MFKYAQLNTSNIVEGISYLNGEVFADNMVLITGLEVELGSTYYQDTQTFGPPTITSDDPQPTIEEKILAENQYQTMLLELNTLGGA